jgi:hypothetical protein
LEEPRRGREGYSTRYDLEGERVDQSAVAWLLSPKPYQCARLCDRVDQQEWDRKRADAALMREDAILDTSSPRTEDKVKNQHVQAVDEWIAITLKETLFEYIKSKALEKTVEKRINEEMARSNLDMNLEEPCEDMFKEDVAMAMKKTVSAMICFGTMKKVVGNHIVNLIEFDKIMAVALDIIMKNKLMQERVPERGWRNDKWKKKNERDCRKREW